MKTSKEKRTILRKCGSQDIIDLIDDLESVIGEKDPHALKNFEKEVYALQDSNGNLIGIDQESGGYPFTPDNLSRVWLCASKIGVQGYMNVEPGRFTLVRVKVILEKV